MSTLVPCIFKFFYFYFLVIIIEAEDSEWSLIGDYYKGCAAVFSLVGITDGEAGF
jgi:hypothetical protein